MGPGDILVTSDGIDGAMMGGIGQKELVLPVNVIGLVVRFVFHDSLTHDAGGSLQSDSAGIENKGGW